MPTDAYPSLTARARRERVERFHDLRDRVPPTLTRIDLLLPGLRLSCGAELSEVRLRGQHIGPEGDAARLRRHVTWSEDDAADSGRISPPHPSATAPSLAQEPLDSSLPTVLILHALTADSRVAGPAGWWSDRVGPGLPLDPQHARVLCFNNLGSCYGSTGPLEVGFPTRAECPARWASWDKGYFSLPEDRLPAPLTTWDQARAILLALDALGIHTVEVVVGGSVGGMIALALAALAPQRFPSLVPIATLDRATPWILGWNHIARQGIAQALRDGRDPRDALALARQLAHMTYRAAPGLDQRQGRRQVGGEGLQAPYAAQTYLTHQGGKLVQRFDAASYLAQLDAMDHHDLSHPPPDPGPHESWSPGPGPWGGLARITGRIDAVGIDTDVLFLPSDLERMLHQHLDRGRQGSWTLLQSPHGHDAFLLPSPDLDGVLAHALRRARAPETP